MRSCPIMRRARRTGLSKRPDHLIAHFDPSRHLTVYEVLYDPLARINCR